jgi:hypothetical protein
MAAAEVVAAQLAAATIPAAQTEHHLAAAAADRYEVAIVQALAAARSAALLDTAAPALLMAAGLAAPASLRAVPKTSWFSPGHTTQPLHSPGACHRWGNNPVRHLNKFSGTMDIVSSIFTFPRRLNHVYSLANQEATNVIESFEQFSSHLFIRKTTSAASYLKKIPCSISR